MENTDKLAAALVKAQLGIKTAKKDSVNPFFNSKYADLESVWEACGEALAENGLSVMQYGIFHDGKFFLRSTLLHSSGQSVSGDYLVNPTKDDPQGYGSAWTYARRYSLAAMVGVTSGDPDDDANAASARVASPNGSTNAARSIAPEEAGFEVARFIPSRVAFVDGKGKGAGKIFAEVYRQDGVSFSGNHQQGELAESARASQREIIISFEKKGKFCNIRNGGLKIVQDDSKPDPEPAIQEVPF